MILLTTSTTKRYQNILQKIATLIGTLYNHFTQTFAPETSAGIFHKEEWDFHLQTLQTSDTNSEKRPQKNVNYILESFSLQPS